MNSMSQWNGYFAREFEENDLNKYKHIRETIKNKVDNVLEHPKSGESLKHSLAGLRSVSVKGNYIMIYMIYKEWKEEQESEIPSWGENIEEPEDAVVFLTVKPHDPAYKFAEDWAQVNVLDFEALSGIFTSLNLKVA